MREERLYIVSYDIREPRRWRRVFKAMSGFGEWLQLSVFQCRLTRTGVLRMEDVIGGFVNRDEDQVLILDLGPAESVKPRVRSIGRKYEPPTVEPIIV